MGDVNILKAGDRGIVVDFGDLIDPAVNARVHRLARAIAQALPECDAQTHIEPQEVRAAASGELGVDAPA